MRNIDRIKGLQNQLEELQRQKAKLLADKNTLIKANEEIQAANNAVMISVALAYGKKSDDGTRELKIPKINVIDNLTKYVLSAAADGDFRVIRVSPTKEATYGDRCKGH